MSLIRIPCEQCGSTLTRYASQLKNRKYGVFCNRDCLGVFRSKHLTGEWAANYKTGSRNSRSYIEVEAKWHPGANGRGYIFLHRLLVEARLGRFLNDKEVVHHIDHDPRNNHWSNLAIMSQADHAKLHNTKKDRKKGQFQLKGSDL